MAIFDLFGDQTGLPTTRRSKMRYEIEALTPREMWGAGNSATTLICRQKWDVSPRWLVDMVGRVRVGASPTLGESGTVYVPQLIRDIPEPLRYNTDPERVQFCTVADQTEQGDLPTPPTPIAAPGVRGSFGDPDGWPKTLWRKFRMTWESMPYAVLDRTEGVYHLPSMTDIAAGAGVHAGAPELYRYVIRTRKAYTKEMTVPGPSAAAGKGFYVIDADPAKRKLVPGGLAFHIVSYQSITLKWVRVPVGWPPPEGYRPVNPNAVWPPHFNPAALDPAAKRRTRDSFMGTVNHDWFDVAAVDGLACAPGTLLYHGYDDSAKYFDAAGDWVCDVVMNFTHKGGVDTSGTIGGWNHYLDANLKWVEVSSGTAPPGGTAGTAAGTRPYKTNDFNRLFYAI